MTELLAPRPFSRKSKAWAAAAALGALGMWFVSQGGRPLQDPLVEAHFLACGTENEPAGTGMPYWPNEHSKRFYVRGHWDPSGDLKVEVWQFGNPGLVLSRADRTVDGNTIRVAVRWSHPEDGMLAACYAKLGAEITFKGLPKQEYRVIAH